MTLTKESFEDLNIVKLLQNIDSYHNDLDRYKKVVRAKPFWLYQFCQWNAEISLKKWCNKHSPIFSVFREKLRMGDPWRSSAEAKKYFQFFCS